MTFSNVPSGALVPSAVDPDISASIAAYERMKPLKEALGVTDLTDGELQVFAIVAQHTGLDPFSGQIRAVKRKGKVTHQTGIDGYRATAERTREYAGSDEATYDECGCGKLPTGHPSIARVVVHRLLPSGHMVNQTGIARWHELYPEGDEGFMWRKMPFNQPAKCAEANGLRKAFPRVLGSVYIDDEMQQAETVDGSATVLPTAAERIAARRAAAQGDAQALYDGDGLFTEAEAPKLRLTSQEFLDRLDSAGIAEDTARALRLSMFGKAELSDEQRGALWLRLEADSSERELDAALP